MHLKTAITTLYMCRKIYMSLMLYYEVPKI